MEKTHRRWVSTLCAVLAAASVCSAQVFYVAAPNAVRPGAGETVALAVDGTGVKQSINVYFEDYPARSKKISERNVEVTPGTPQIIELRVEPEDLPQAVFTDPTVKHYIVLVAKSGNFAKEVIVPISSQVGYVFLQTDKPIYTPKQNVKMRIIPLNEEALPSQRELRLQIRNPQNVIVEEIDFNQRAQEKKKEFISYIYTFPQHPKLGEWTATVFYGFQLQQNNSITFEVREYVLPTFTVKVKAPEVILPKDQIISGSVEAIFVYGKKVQGTASFKFGLKDNTGNVIYFGELKPKELRGGIAQFSVSTEELKLHPDIGWFPEIENRYLVVEATVMDKATGSTEIAIDDKGRFSSSPFLISFKRCLKDFKPGLVSVIEADITYVNGMPAKDVSAVISAVANNNKPMKIINPSAVTDEEGKISFKIQPEIDHTTVTVTVRTNVPEYDAAAQASAQHTQNKFRSTNNGYIAIARSSGKTLTPGVSFSEVVHFEPAGIADVYYMAVSRGKIEMIKKFPEGKFKEQIVEFPITFNMAPSFRLVVFAVYNGELIVDSLKVDVEKECKPEAKVVLEPNFPLKEPGNPGKIVMRGYKETLVGLLAVDEAVYALRNKDLLTKAKMFKTIETHDLGCGPGGGQTTDTVLGNAGVVIMTNSYSPPDQRTVPSCAERIRRKRELVERIAKRYRGPLRECCILGVKRHNLNATCEERAAIVQNFTLREITSEECSQAFLECCIGKENATNNRARAGGNLQGVLDFVEIEEEDFNEKQLTVRSDFRETWIFEDKLIGPDYIEEFPVSLPHSITTWVIQAVSVHQDWGMCVSKPEKLVSFKKMFIQLNLPYSVVRNEQIEVQATVFNYGLQRLPTVVYMYGVKDLCTGTQEGEKSERKRIYVEAQSAQTVSFPLIPMKDGSFDIRVTALSGGGSDAIMRKLNVVPEGETVERNVPIKLDPSNQQRRSKRHLTTEYCSDSIDESQNLQVTAVKLSLPKDFIPGTESCVVTALGDEFGPTIETSLHDPDRLLLKPHGCGEQTMVYLAPTVYTMHYLTVTRQVSPANEQKGYGFIREGYGRELTYRKADGSYAAWTHRDSSTWLTAFVTKVFCQADTLVHIDENVLCSGITWLLQKQQADGSFLESAPVIHKEMTGGVNGLIPMTAFVLITLQECNCEVPNLLISKSRAIAYLENNLERVVDPFTTALVAYALALSGSESSSEANRKLLALGTYNEDSNTLFWATGGSTRDIETTSYALLTQLQHNNMVKSLSIVNWLNTKRLPSGSYPSTQDTVMAIQALSEYAIKARHTGLNIVSNITSSNDRTLSKTLAFHTDNALVMQQLKIDKIGGTLFIKTEGHGVGLMSVNLRYNIPRPPEQLCKFDLDVTVTEVRIAKVKPVPNLPQGANDVFEFLPDDLIRAVGAGEAAAENNVDVEPEIDPRARPPPDEQDQPRAARIGIPPFLRREFENEEAINDEEEGGRRVKRDNDEKNTLGLEIQICTKFLGQKETDMTILDVGIFTGFQPYMEDLEKLLKNRESLVDKYELSSRGIVFYLQKTPFVQPVCLKFRIKRDYIVGNTQTSIIKIYDYYNPDDSCTKFYSPDQNSPMLRKICENGICQCAEGGCPPNTPFAEITRIQEEYREDKATASRKMREKLKEIACDNHDYVWKGKAEKLRPEGGFIYITFLVQEIFKPGIEGRDILEKAKRELMVRDNCDFAKLVPGQTYVIMGKDGEKYENANGELWYRYLMDKTTSIYHWKEMQGIKKKDKPMQITFSWLQRESAKNICDQ